MTLGRIVAPRSMPDEAPGLEHTIHHCYYGLTYYSLGRSTHKSIWILETRQITPTHNTEGELIVEKLQTV